MMFIRSLADFNRAPWAVWWQLALSPSPPRPSAPGKDTTSPQRSGDFYLATSGDFLLATDGDFLMAIHIAVCHLGSSSRRAAVWQRGPRVSRESRECWHAARGWPMEPTEGATNNPTLRPNERHRHDCPAHLRRRDQRARLRPGCQHPHRQPCLMPSLGAGHVEATGNGGSNRSSPRLDRSNANGCAKPGPPTVRKAAGFTS